nr:cation channel sperm-associated protein subunit beta-like [Salvelinus alpinus]
MSPNSQSVTTNGSTRTSDHMENKRLLNLPVNYRPPSQLGVLIPTTDNIYNADPSHPHPRQHYPISKNSGRYKQCAGKRSAEECGCTDRLKVSPLAINSDCRQRSFPCPLCCTVVLS